MNTIARVLSTQLFPEAFRAIQAWLTRVMPGPWADFILMLLTVLVLVLFVFTAVILAVWMERKVIGRIQDRHGPMNAGFHGILQTVADAIKLLTKEDIMTTNVDRWVFNVAPIIVFFPVLVILALIPWGSDTVGANLAVGLLLVISVGSISTVGILSAGWGSNNKYSLLGGMRAAAQLISYEIPLGLSVLSVVMLTHSLSLSGIVGGQNGVAWLFYIEPVAFLLFFISATSELNRTPFDLPEAESELGAGYHTEYSGMKFAVFFLAEYGNTVTSSALAAILFFGGWHPLLLPLPPFLWLFIKIVVIFFVFSWMRGALPRLRIDQLLAFSWKLLIPLSVANIVVTALALALSVNLPGQPTYAFVFGGNILLILGVALVFAIRNATLGRHAGTLAGPEIRVAG